tara:strand:- start:160 stop:579 length:420 start_codon:yes stop_codon:yes gene_type:complete
MPYPYSDGAFSIWRIKMSGYSANLDDGREIYIPKWSAKIQFENLTQACKIFGQDSIITISALNVPAAMLAVMGSDDGELSTKFMFHVVQQARMDGDKLTAASINAMPMIEIVELFTHVLHSQFNDFFVSGLAKVNSPAS